MKLDIAAGNVDEGGGLTREQVARVVRAHANAIKFCYEKELQRKPTLGGKIEAYWVIVPDGSVEKSKIAATTMDDGAVEGCIARQVKQWVFPSPTGAPWSRATPSCSRVGCDDARRVTRGARQLSGVAGVAINLPHIRRDGGGLRCHGFVSFE